MVKNSFTLFETILSITILSIVISGFIKSTYYDNKNTQYYSLLNDLENNFDTNNYESLNVSNKILEITINKTQTKNILVKIYKYEDENIKVFKYEK